MHKKWRGEKIKTIKRIRHNGERERQGKNFIRLNRTNELYIILERREHSTRVNDTRHANFCPSYINLFFFSSKGLL